MFLRIILVLTVLVPLRISSERTLKHLPTYIPRCYRGDPKLNDCLLKGTEQIKPYLLKGIPEIDLPPIDPFYIPEITLEQGTNAVDYKAALKNVIVKGLGNYHFNKFEFDVENIKFHAIVQVDNITIDGNYFVNGKILTVPLEGNGKVVTNISSTNSTITVHGKLVNESGHTFIFVDKTDVSLDIGDVTYKVDGLFDGNEVLAKAVRNVVRDNLRELIEEVKPTIENVLIQIINGIINKSVGTVDVDELYPPAYPPQNKT